MGLTAGPVPARVDGDVKAGLLEMSVHAQRTVETGILVFLADPQSPWQRGTNTDTNCLRRFGQC